MLSFPDRRPMSRKPVFILVAIALGVLLGGLSHFADRRDAVGSSSATRDVVEQPHERSDRNAPHPPGPPIPEFTHARVPAPKSVENDPGSPMYDAVALMEATGAPLRAIFNKEPKNPKWSPHVEEQFRFFFSHDLEADALKARIRSVDCRTRVCELVVEADTDQDLKMANRLLQYTGIANVFQPDGSAEQGPAHRFLFAFSGTYRDVVGWNVTYPQRRNQELAQLREKVKSATPEQLRDIPAIPPDVPPPTE